MFLEIPLKNVDTLYSSNNQHRYSQLIARFTELYGEKPQFIARAPGRVDIIGGHLDYNDYPVLPVALQTDCLIAVRTNNSKDVQVTHIHSDFYPPQILPVDPESKVQFISNHLKYFRAGYRAGVKHFSPEKLKGMQIVVGGNVPTAVGLSSSAAFTVCSALAAMHANEGNVGQYIQGSREQFLQRVIEGQKQTGVAAGGMDQSISVLGKADTCLYIEFSPIKCRPVTLPQGLQFIVMNTLVEEVKLESAPFHLNKRFCQCRIAAALLGKKLGFPGPKSAKTLKQLQRWSGLSAKALSQSVSTFIRRHDYSASEIEAELGLSLFEVLADIPLHDEVINKNKIFRIWQAAKHILEEANRLELFVSVCGSKIAPQLQRQLLGKIIQQSMESANTLYDCSCPESNQLAALALSKGSLGTKITGAGWGGCTVSLVESHQAHQFIQSMIASYYQKKPQLQQKINKIGIENIIFESKPSEGACLIVDL